MWAGWSVAEDRQVELAQADRVGEDVDFGDLPVLDGEAHDRERLPAPGYVVRGPAWTLGGHSRPVPKRLATRQLAFLWQA